MSPWPRNVNQMASGNPGAVHWRQFNYPPNSPIIKSRIVTRGPAIEWPHVSSLSAVEPHGAAVDRAGAACHITDETRQLTLATAVDRSFGTVHLFNLITRFCKACVNIGRVRSRLDVVCGDDAHISCLARLRPDSKVILAAGSNAHHYVCFGPNLRDVDHSQPGNRSAVQGERGECDPPGNVRSSGLRFIQATNRSRVGGGRHSLWGRCRSTRAGNGSRSICTASNPEPRRSMSSAGCAAGQQFIRRSPWMSWTNHWDRGK